MERRVVITGLGAVAPNGVSIPEFLCSLREGRSGILHFPELREYSFLCQLGGKPPLDDDWVQSFQDHFNIVKLRSLGILYGCIAGVEAWQDAGLSILDTKSAFPDWDAGCIFGSNTNGLEAIQQAILLTDQGNLKKIGGRAAQQAMNSGISAYLGGILGLGNQVTTNSSTCNTGTESILDAYSRIRFGLAERMLAGSSEGSSHHIWAAYDAMLFDDSIFSPRQGSSHVMAHGYSSSPKEASRPLSKQASGFVPGSGAGALVLESLGSAQRRGAKIYAEIVGGCINSGAGSMRGKLVNNCEVSMKHCIQHSVASAGIEPSRIGLISGHLTGIPVLDLAEVKAWSAGLSLGGKFPPINSTKSMTGHCFGASGSIEVVASVLQLYHDFVHPSLNAAEMQSEIRDLVGDTSVSVSAVSPIKTDYLIKGSFGFGGSNSCIVLKRWSGNGDEK